MIEDYVAGGWNPTNNPNYNQPSDSMDTLNLDLCADITRATAAALVELADE